MKKILKTRAGLAVCVLALIALFAGVALATITHNDDVTINGPDAVGYSGADAPDVLVVNGGVGASNSSGDGGKGADILLTAGDANDESPLGAGGDGGSVVLTSGVGGDGWFGDGGDGGDIELTTGPGGVSEEGPGVAGSYGNIIMVENGGRVGIGTATPSKLLDVNGDADVGGTLTMDELVLPVKTTTGDPASPVAGQIYVNTYDNKVRVYADGAWRDLATW